MFKANQLFSLEINVLYNLMLNMGMFTYVIKISSKILPLSYPFVDICLQDWSSLCADVVFTRDTFLRVRNCIYIYIIIILYFHLQLMPKSVGLKILGLKLIKRNCIII